VEPEVSTQPKARITREEYLALERKSEVRSEYFDGEMFAMSGALREHNRVVVNIASELSNQFLDRPCEIYATDMRTKVSPTGLYTYPDIVVLCGEPEFEDEHLDTLINPQAIIEVLSESTESYDRGKKFAHYRTIDSLREYFLVTTTECRVERFSRQEDGNWLYTESTDPGGSIELDSAACRLFLSRIYHKVDFEGAMRRQDARRASPPSRPA
jgi:Uma2 family endonuclease